eukprot:9919087-Heterocapsa_arctica.AAC.1
MINQGQQTARGPRTFESGMQAEPRTNNSSTQDDRTHTADASMGGDTVYHDMATGDDDTTMDEP